MSRRLASILTILLLFATIQGVDAEEPPKESKPGTYFYEIEAENEKGEIITTVMKVTVLGNHTTISNTHHEAIDANDFRKEFGEVVNLDENELIEIAQAHAWSTETGLEIPIFNTSVDAVSKRMYKVTFRTKLGTSTTVNAVEFESNFFDWDKELINPTEMYFLNLTIPPLWALLLMIIPLVIISITYYITQRRIKKANDILYEKQVHLNQRVKK